MDAENLLSLLLLTAIALLLVAIWNWWRTVYAKCPKCKKRWDSREPVCPHCALKDVWEDDSWRSSTIPSKLSQL